MCWMCWMCFDNNFITITSRRYATFMIYKMNEPHVFFHKGIVRPDKTITVRLALSTLYRYRIQFKTQNDEIVLDEPLTMGKTYHL